jgi:hypothetical protein
MRRIMAGVVTVALMGILAWSGIRRPAANREASRGAANVANPAEARVHSLLESAWNGDVPAYLAAFDGPIRTRLEREVDERGRARFAVDLQLAARSRKSHAVFAAEPENDDTARVAVETVYPDRNERQTYRLDRKAEGWFVTEVETLRSHQPKAAYGTQASYEAPEGVPVQPPVIGVETGEESNGP